MLYYKVTLYYDIHSIRLFGRGFTITASGAEVGTLYHIRNLLQRRAVLKK